MLQVGVHAFDSAIIALGVLSMLRRLLPLQALSRVRYFVHACGTACGVHYVVRLACRLGVSWASDRWIQLHAAAVSSGLLVCVPCHTQAWTTAYAPDFSRVFVAHVAEH